MRSGVFVNYGRGDCEAYWTMLKGNATVSKHRNLSWSPGALEQYATHYMGGAPEHANEQGLGCFAQRPHRNDSSTHNSDSKNKSNPNNHSNTINKSNNNNNNNNNKTTTTTTTTNYSNNNNSAKDETGIATVDPPLNANGRCCRRRPRVGTWLHGGVVATKTAATITTPKNINDSSGHDSSNNMYRVMGSVLHVSVGIDRQPADNISSIYNDSNNQQEYR